MGAHQTLIDTLARLYPEPASELVFSGEYQLVVAVMLSAQCTDKKVNQVTPSLFAAYPDFSALRAAPRDAVEHLIRPINYYRTKSKHLIAMAERVCTTYHGALPHTHHELMTLPGVGNKTANVVLSELRITPTFPVDTHVFRVARRLGLARGRTRERVESELKRQFPEQLWRNLHHWLIFHGRRTCKAQRPLCQECALRDICPTGVRVQKKVATKKSPARRVPRR